MAVETWRLRPIVLGRKGLPMLFAALLLLLPLGLRYATIRHMAGLRARMLRSDAELRQLQTRLDQVRVQLHEARRRRRQYEVRKTFVIGDIREQTRRLDELRSAPEDRRLAA